MFSFSFIVLFAWLLPAVFGFGASRMDAPLGATMAARSALYATAKAAAPAKATAKAAGEKTQFMGKGAIIDALRDSTNLKRKDVEAVIDGFQALVVNTIIKSGTSVRLSKFGTFRLRKASARPFRNPKTGEKGVSKPFKSIAFSASNALRKY